MKKLALACAVALAGLVSLGAQEQTLQVTQSNGYVEALLGDLGWRQAVVGRELPGGSVLASWLKAGATMGYRDGVLKVGPLTHLTVLLVEAERLRLSLDAGTLEIQSTGLAIEIRFRGMLVRLEKGHALLSDGILTLQEGSGQLSGIAGGNSVKLAAGARVDLLSQAIGPVFR